MDKLNPLEIISLIQTAWMEIFKGLRDTKGVSVFLKNMFWTTLLPLFLLFSISYYDENHHLSANTFVNVSVYIFQTLSISKVQLIHMIYILYYHMHTENRHKERETSWITWILTGVWQRLAWVLSNLKLRFVLSCVCIHGLWCCWSKGKEHYESIFNCHYWNCRSQISLF